MDGILGTDVPIVAAPMAGGATTPDLVAAATQAGGFGFLAGGCKTAEAMTREIGVLRERGVEHFGMNLFVPTPSGLDEPAFRRYAEAIQPDADRFGLDLSDEQLREDDDQWRRKIDALVASPVSILSLTFGIPPAADLRALQRAGTIVLVTVTTAGEARSARDAGADGLVVQGSAAGGHSGTHDPHRAITPVETDALVRDVVAATELPVVAGGGVDGPESVRRLLAAGADAVAVGTLLLRSDESGAAQVHQDALVDDRFAQTVITTAFTGRPARGLRNAFIDDHEAQAPLGYPAIHHLTRGMRQAAVRAGDADRVHLWAGTGHRNARTGPAAGIIAALAPTGP
ncbi:MAG: nitronate monooxygenase [Nocardioidaceae bacterium]|nr:nitronate monooxygenase [Nocardioidaceae bacterium]